LHPDDVEFPATLWLIHRKEKPVYHRSKF